MMVLLTLPELASAQNAPPIKPGFPHDIAQPSIGARPIGGIPAVADLGLRAGYKSIVFALENRRIYVLRKAASGTAWETAPGWPQTLPAVAYSSPAIGDLDNDGDLDIVVGYGWTGTANTHPGGIHAFRADGTTLWTVTTRDVTPGPANGQADPVMATPAIGDVDGDGKNEVVVGATDHRLYVLNGEDGSALTGWTSGGFPGLDVQDTVFSGASLFDLDGDGKLEIIVGIDRYLVNGGRLLVKRHDGTDFPGFAAGTKDFDQTIVSSPAVGDIDGDGKPDIVHGTGTYYYIGRDGVTDEPLKAVYAWDCEGNAVAGWPVTEADGLMGQIEKAVALANLDGDPSTLEVVAVGVEDPTPSSYPSGDEHYFVNVIRHDGTVLWTQEILDYNILSLSGGDPIVADVFASSSGLEILVSTNGEIAVFRGSDGTPLTDTDYTAGGGGDEPSMMSAAGGLSGVVATDLETDGAGDLIEVIAVNAASHPPSTSTTVRISVWNPGAGSSTPPWGEFRQSSETGRRGIYPGTPNCLDENCIPPTTGLDFTPVTPCRAYDSRDIGVGAFANNVSRDIDVRGRDCSGAGIPADAVSVAINATVASPTRSGSVALHMGSCTAVGLETISFSTGQTRANNAVMPLSLDGNCELRAKAQLSGSGSVHLIIDVTGYFAPASVE